MEKRLPEVEASQDYAAFALELALRARLETLARFAQHYAVENKGLEGAFDPVTEADRAAELAIRDLISNRYPDHAIHGEELGEKIGDSPYTWVLDPIDGTRSYMCGLPTWTTLIALLRGGEPVLGLVDAPSLDEIYIGHGERALLIGKDDGAQIRTSACSRLDEARFSTTDPFLLGSRNGLIERILRSVRVARYGHDGYAYARLAAGKIDLVIETGLQPYDFHAHIPLIRAAGGHIGDWKGGSDFAAGDVIAAASRELYDEAVELVGEK